MKKSRFTEEQMVTIMRGADRTTVGRSRQEAQGQRCPNEVRPHSSLQYLTPAEFKQQPRQNLQPAVF